jgi:hypothetical protein
LICGGSVRRVAILAPPVAGLFTALVMSAATAQLNCNPGIEFYAEGPIKACNLNGNHRLYTVRGDVVVCADGHPLVQFPDGRLQSCTVAEPSVIAGERCEASSRVELAPDGALESCRKS